MTMIVSSLHSSKTMMVSTIHPQSLNDRWTLLKVSDDFEILGSSVNFQSSFSNAWYLKVVLATNPWCLHEIFFLFLGFVLFCLHVLEYCSAVWCSAANTHPKLPNSVVSGARFQRAVWLSVSLNIVDLWQHYVCCTRSGVTWCTPSMVFYLCRMCQCGLVAHRYTYAPPRRRSLQYSRTLKFSVRISVVWSFRPRIRWCGTGGFQKQSPCHIIGLTALSLFVSSCFAFLFFHSMGWYCGAGVNALIRC